MISYINVIFLRVRIKRNEAKACSEEHQREAEKVSQTKSVKYIVKE